MSFVVSMNLFSSSQYNEGAIMKYIFFKFIFFIKSFTLLLCNPEMLFNIIFSLLLMFELLQKIIVPTKPSKPKKKFK